MKNFQFWKILLLRWISAIFIFIFWILLVNDYFKCIGLLPLLFESIFLYSNMQKIGKSIKVKINLFKKNYILLLVIFLLIFTLSLYIEPIMKYQAEKNKLELQRIVDDLVKNYTNDIEKTKAILSWFDKSKENIIYLPTKNILFKLYPLYITLKKPYFCIRLIEHKYPLWILTSRCGRCAEFSLLFREMAHASNLTVRSVHNPGEDHNWDEVLINGKWIVVDSTQVDPFQNKTGFNYSAHEYEREHNLNISYVFAEYPNGSREDIRYRYTNLSNIAFKLIDQKGNLIPDAIVQIISNNLKNKKMDTNLNCTTNNKGRCSLTVGGGDYKFVAKTNNFIPLYNETSKIIEENREYNITLILKRNILKTNAPQQLYQIFLIVVIILLWFFIVFYFELSKIK